jgi:hypothetical protein
MHPEILEGPQESLLALLERAAIPPALYLASGTALALLAQIRDIACMKLSAIMSRGSRRDFVDLYAVCQHGHNLEEVYGWFQQKYQGILYDPYHLARSLVYFLDAEEERMPVMLWPCRWDEVKAFFVHESQRVFST